MQLMDPTVMAAEQANTRAPELASFDGKTVGLLSNGKLNADLLLLETAAIFKARHGCEVLALAYKRNPSAPAPKGSIDDLAVRCDFLITATGD